MRKTIIFFVLACLPIWIILSCKTDKQTSQNTTKQLYDSVVVYLYDGFMGQEIVDSTRHLDSTVVTQLNLNSSQITELSALISQKRLAKSDSLCEEAACCSPHHGIVFYKNQKPSQWMSICFDCNCMNSTIQTEICPTYLVDFFKSLHLKVGNKELIPEHFGMFDPQGDIRKINRAKFGSSYDSLRHNL